MKNYGLKAIVKNGIELPIIELKDIKLIGIPEFCMAMPIIAEKKDICIKTFGYLDSSNVFIGEKKLYQILLRFQIEKYLQLNQNIFFQKGKVKLWYNDNNKTIASATYEGIQPQLELRFELGNRLNQSIANIMVTNQFKILTQRASPKEFVFKYPLSDLFVFAGIDSNDKSISVDRYIFNDSEDRFVLFNDFLQNRAKSTLLDSPLYLANKREIHNPKAIEYAKIQNNNINFLGTQKININYLQLATLTQINTSIKNLPLNQEIEKGIYKDKESSIKYWSVSKFELLIPQLGNTFENSPFNFKFFVKGTDLSGNPILESHIKFTLSNSIAEAERKFSEKNVVKISQENLSISLLIPYLDANGRESKTEITGDIESEGQDIIVVKFILSNEWTRIVYAALSNTAPTKTIQLEAKFLFNAFAKKLNNLFNVVSINKVNKIDIVSNFTRELDRSKPVFVASTNTLQTVSGVNIQYNHTPISAIYTPLITAAALQAVTVTPVIKPENPIKDEDYQIVTLKYSQPVILEFPCDLFGEMYREEIDGVLMPIGCKEPYKLGNKPPNLYKEIEALRNSTYKILHSTQVPNRFVVVPEQYVISREVESKKSPFLPNIHIYSTFDVNKPELSHSLLNTFLQPKLKAYQLLKLKYELKRYTTYEPEISMINEIGGEQNFTWTLPNSIYSEINTSSMGSLIDFTLKAKIEQTLTLINLLKNGSQGIKGSLSVKTEDGLIYNSQLNVVLNDCEGPWLNQPLKILTQDGDILIKNVLSADVDIGGYIYEKDGQLLQINAVKKLLPSETFSLGNTVNIGGFAIYSIGNENVSVGETNTYLEDISCQIIFICTNTVILPSLVNVKIQYGLKDVIQTLVAEYSGSWPIEVYMPMPLSNYLNNKQIRFNVEAFNTLTNTIINTPFVAWDLNVSPIIDISNILSN